MNFLYQYPEVEDPEDEQCLDMHEQSIAGLGIFSDDECFYEYPDFDVRNLDKSWTTYSE